jgi:hypothetical protein
MKYFSLLAAIVLALASCKSKDDNSNPTPSGLLSGYLTVARQLDLDSPATKYTEQAWAAFFMHPYEQPGDTMHIVVDSVRLNGMNTALDNMTRTYRISGTLQANSNCNWQVWSGTNIASFSYSFTTPYPSYTTAMPDTIDRSTGFAIGLPTGADSATILLSGNVSLMNSFKGPSGGYSASDLANFNGGAAVLEVTGYKKSVQAFGGKNFLFTKQTTKTKALWLK